MTRSEFMIRFLAALCALALALPLALAAGAFPDRPAALRGADFIRTTQQDDGGFGGFGAGQTFDAIYAIRAAGLDPNTFVRNGKTPADFLKAVAAAQETPGSAAKAALAAEALGLNPRSVAGVDLIARVQAGLDPITRRYSADDFSHAIAMIGLACTGTPVPNRPILALRNSQLADGGWGFGGASDPDTTAIALQALVAADIPRSDDDAVEAVAYLKATQAADGGWGFDPAASNASSTAFVVQALIAAGEDPSSAAYAKVGGTPIDFLLGQQQADGSLPGFDAAFATNQAVPALAGRTFCNAPDTPILGPFPPAPAPASPTTAPKPPATGTGLAHGGGVDGIPIVVAVVILSGLLFAVVARRRPR